MALDHEGHVWSCGGNQHGQLGVNDTNSRSSPCKISTLKNVRSVEGGYWHCIALDSQGHVWSWGDNIHGSLGLGDDNERLSPEQIQTLPEITSIHVGGVHALCVDLNGNVWVFGNNEDGELGLGDSKKRNIPTRLSCFDLTISEEKYHTLEVKAVNSDNALESEIITII